MYLGRSQRDACAYLMGVVACGALLLSACLPFPFSAPVRALLPRPTRTVVSNTLPLRQKWEHRIDEFLLAPLVFRGGLIYVHQGNRLSALNAETGQKEWTFARRSAISALRPGIVVSGDTLALDMEADLYEEIIVLDATTGQVRWAKGADVVYSFAFGGRWLYVGSMGRVRAYDLENGELLWEMSKGLPPSHSIIDVYYDGGVLAAITERQVYLVDGGDGRVLKTYAYPVTRVNILSEGTLYYVDQSHSLAAVNAQSGDTIWTDRISPNVDYLPPTLLDGVLYVPTDDGQLQAIDAKTGAKKWASAKMGFPFSNVVKFHDKGYVVSDDGRLHGFDLANGNEVGVLRTSPESLSVWPAGRPAIPSLAAVGDTLVVTFGDDFIYGFEVRAD